LNSKPDSETSLQQETSRRSLDNISRESLENLHGKDSEKPKLIHNFLNNPVLNIALGLASVLSAVTDFKKIPQPLKQALDKYSVVLIKAAMIARYLETAVEAFK
jgi:hypothetical protein